MTGKRVDLNSHGEFELYLELTRGAEFKEIEMPENPDWHPPHLESGEAEDMAVALRRIIRTLREMVLYLDDMEDREHLVKAATAIDEASDRLAAAVGWLT